MLAAQPTLIPLFRWRAHHLLGLLPVKDFLAPKWEWQQSPKKLHTWGSRGEALCKKAAIIKRPGVEEGEGSRVCPSAGGVIKRKHDRLVEDQAV